MQTCDTTRREAQVSPQYPFLELFWTMLVFLWILWISLLFTTTDAMAWADPQPLDNPETPTR